MYAGVFMSESSEEEVKERDHTIIDAPKDCFGYRFFSREEAEDHGEILKGKNKDYSGFYYFGTVMTKEQVEKHVDNPDTLLSNMRINNWDRVVKTRLGNFQPFNRDKDVILTNV